MKERGPKVCVLKADGTNCDTEMAKAFEMVGGRPKIVHVNELRARDETLSKYQILALPGGFAYGDDVASGKILALELTSYLADQLREFKEDQRGLMLGVCNGFQVLIRAGLLPFGTIGEMQATLTNNDVGHFRCSWVNLKIEEGNSCVFLDDTGEIVKFPVAHGEGKFFAPQPVIDRVETEGLVVFRYCTPDGEPTQEYPANPNDSLNAIAGICDPTGRILGLMPHPERFVKRTQYENWHREDRAPQGLQVFQKMVRMF